MFEGRKLSQEGGTEVEPLLRLWQGLGLRQQVILVVSSALVLGAVVSLARIAATPSQTLLFAGLDDRAAGEVVAALDQRGVVYSVRGAAIYVDAGRRDELRLALAAEGMPAAGGQGYELLDNLTGFGTTSQMFDAAQWRAREGELARTLLAMPGIRSARVHLGAPSARPFQRATGVSASVAITTTGGGLTPVQAGAIRHLVASAVAGMNPEDVAVIDSARGLVPGGAGQPDGLTGEDDLAAALRNRVERLLAARVGPGRVAVEVTVEMDRTSEILTTRRLDPESRVAISTDTEERSEEGSGSGGGAVTVASNLPDGEGGAGRETRSARTEARERINFEVGETRSEITRAPGALRRLTVAVLVDGLRSSGPNGEQVWQPRPEAEMAALRALVEAAVGFDPERGDIVTLHGMELDLSAPGGTVATASLLAGFDLGTLVQLVVFAAVALVLGLFVLRPLLMRPPVGPASLPMPGMPDRALPAPDTPRGALPAPVHPQQEDNPDLARDRNGPDLVRLVSERRDEVVEVLRAWIEAEPGPMT